MTLSDAQVKEYSEKGWLCLPSVFDETEVSVLEAASHDVTQHDGPEVARDPNGKPHVVYGMHLLDPRLQALTHHPKLVEPAEQLLGSKFFVHQSRVNVKNMGTSIVKWHQDFGTYHRVDGLPDPRGIMIAVFLDDITPCNAPLLAIPGSHKHGLVSKAYTDESSEDFSTVAKYRYDIPDETLAELTREHGVEAIMGPAGSLLLMDMTVVHGSTINITPLRRIILYLNVSAVDNRGETYERPEYYAARDFSPVLPYDEDCLRNLAA